MAHLHNIYDSDIHFKLDSKTRTFSNETELKLLVAQGDHNSERITFEIPRYIEQHDMLKCNRIEVHYINISSTTRDTSKDVYIVDDAQVSPEDENVVEFSWLLSGRATQYNGTLSFAISMKCLTDEVIDYRWNTLTYEKILVGKSLNNAETIAQEYSDVLEKWKKEVLENINPTVTIDTELNEKSDNAIANCTVAKKISQLSDSIANLGKPSDEQVSSAVNNYIEENGISAGGLTKAQITLFEQLFNNLAYTDNVIGKATADSLIASLRAGASSGGDTPSNPDTPDTPNTFNVTISAPNTTYDNQSLSGTLGESYTVTFTPNEQYKLGNATVTMGGVDVTSTVYANGVINIPQVTGDIIIMVETISTKAIAIYSLPQATTFDGDDFIDTNITLDIPNSSWSIVGDVTNATSGDVFATHGAITAQSLRVHNHGNGWGVYHMDGNNSVKVDSDNWDGTFKFVITHKSGEVTVDVYCVLNGELNKQTGTLNPQYINKTPSTLKLGSNYNATGDWFKGTINDFKIYNEMLIDDEINEYLGV